MKQLPGIRAYQQNHVLDEWNAGQDPSFRIDGIVELQFDSMDAMSVAFASAAATPVKADEPNFLGHGTGYVSAGPHSPVPSADGCKLVVARNPRDVSAGDVLERTLHRIPQLTHLIRDDVQPSFHVRRWRKDRNRRTCSSTRTSQTPTRRCTPPDISHKAACTHRVPSSASGRSLLCRVVGRTMAAAD